MWSSERRERPSEEKMVSFWERERAIRSWVRGHLEVEVRGLGESQPDLEDMLTVGLIRDSEGCKWG